MTAENFIPDNNYHFIETFNGNTETCIPIKDIPEMMIEFAKYHVEKALKEASENADMDYEFYQSSQEGSSGFIDKESILNAYPTNLIK